MQKKKTKFWSLISLNILLILFAIGLFIYSFMHATQDYLTITGPITVSFTSGTVPVYLAIIGIINICLLCLNKYSKSAKAKFIVKDVLYSAFLLYLSNLAFNFTHVYMAVSFSWLIILISCFIFTALFGLFEALEYLNRKYLNIGWKIFNTIVKCIFCFTYGLLLFDMSEVYIYIVLQIILFVVLNKYLNNFKKQKSVA